MRGDETAPVRQGDAENRDGEQSNFLLQRFRGREPGIHAEAKRRVLLLSKK